ncbi:MAG: hypothetical protein AAF363_00970 [Bacteroidota bacterium]
MAKLKNIVQQLSENDYKSIYDSLMTSNADKSAYLLSSLREEQLSDNDIMDTLEVNTNAYYTLRSRLNQKIEEYLLQQMESPRTDILKKVANINEIAFTRKPAIVIATLKKLEKELSDYDLANELTVIYKLLKKLHLNSPDYFTYSQLYNRHVAYMLAVDKAEDLLAEYFKKYGNFFLTGEETSKLELSLLIKEVKNIGALYESHRLYVYQSSMAIFHRLFVENNEEETEDVEPIEDILEKVERTFDDYQMDSMYYHLRLVFEFLRYEYYSHYRVFSKAEKYFEGINDAKANLLANYGLYTFPSQFLISKLKRAIRQGSEKELYGQSSGLLIDYEPDKDDIPGYVVYTVYRALACFYSEKFEEAANWLNDFLNEVSLKKYHYLHMEVKVLLGLQYCLMHDFELFNQIGNSIQRQIRLFGKENCEHIVLFLKALKISSSVNKSQKEQKISAAFDKITMDNVGYFSPITYIKRDEKFIKLLTQYK